MAATTLVPSPVARARKGLCTSALSLWNVGCVQTCMQIFGHGAACGCMAATYVLLNFACLNCYKFLNGDMLDVHGSPDPKGRDYISTQSWVSVQWASNRELVKPTMGYAPIWGMRDPWMEQYL